MRRNAWPILLVLLALALLAGCNSPSDKEVMTCVKTMIGERMESSPSGPIMCDNYVEVLGVKVADSRIEGNSARIIADVSWQAKRLFGKSSATASICFVSATDPVTYYEVGEITNSKIEVELEKWASGWKCKK